MGTRIFRFNVFVTAMPDQTQEDVREHLKSVVVRGMLLEPGGKEYSKRFVAVRITGGDFVGPGRVQEDTAHQEQLAERETPSVEQFLAAIGEVCRKHGYSIGHEDGHGAFIVHRFDESDLEWLGGASIELDSDEVPQPTCTCTLANVDYINDCPVHDGRTMAEYEEARAKHLGELRAEREMVQAQTPVVNEDGE